MRRLLFWAWLGVVVVLSVLPDDEVAAMSLKVTDSGFFLHVLAYCVGTFLCCTAFAGSAGRGTGGWWGGHGSTRLVVVCGGSIFLLGTLLECLQLVVPERSFNITDIAANLCGIVLYGIAFSVVVTVRAGKDRQ